MAVEDGQPTKQLRYPKSVSLIVGYEFCERFCFASIQVILILYLRNDLYYSEKTSTVIFHIFSMFSFFLPLVGAILADSWIGGFRCIFYMNFIYAIGLLLLVASAIPFLHFADRTFALVGLGLIAIAFGGIKPSFIPFGCDQFELPQQERYLQKFFSMMYITVNAAALVSLLTIPILRADVSCFGKNTCFALALFVPTCVMILNIVIFTLGKKMYTIKCPTENSILKAAKCITHGICNKLKAKDSEGREHWLDYADDEYDTRTIADIRSGFAVLKMLLPLSVFFALLTQPESRWMIQATRMNGQIGSYVLLPDQMPLINTLLTVMIIPISEQYIYPALAKVRLIHTPLQKITIGGILSALAYVLAGLLELKLETTYAVTPSPGFAQLRIFNTLNCPVVMSVGEQAFVLKNLSVWENKYIAANGNVTLNYTANYSHCSILGITPEINRGTITGIEATAISWVITPMGMSYSYVDSVDKTLTGDPAVRALVYLNELVGSSAALSFVKNSGTTLSFNVTSHFFKTNLTELNPATYDIYFNNNLIESSVDLKTGGIYTVIASGDTLNTSVANTITVTDPNSIHMLWLLPQCLVLSFGNIMISVTGTQFVVTQAPVRMKILFMALWYLTASMGNLIVAIVAQMSWFDSQATESFVFAAIGSVDAIIFAVMAKFYKYVELPGNGAANEEVAGHRKYSSVNSSSEANKEA